MERSSRRWVGFACGLLAAVASPLRGQTELTGQTELGAYYRVQTPEGWQPGDGLVIWNHGFSLDPLSPNPSLGELAELQLAQGYAVGASSYSQRGWALFQTTQDLRDLVAVFESELGAPGEILITGASLGGIVTARAIEDGGLGNVAGAFVLCGALAGSQLWDGALDLRLIVNNVCEADVLPPIEEALPLPGDPAFELEVAAEALALNNCTGILLPELLRSSQQRANLERILQLAGIPESFFLTDLSFVTFGLSDLIHDPEKLAGAIGVTNLNVDYGDADVNSTIVRVAADAAGRKLLLQNFTPKGTVGGTKIVSLHTDKDGLVFVENESEYAKVVPPGNLTTAIAVEEEATHCGFTEAEVVASWEALRAWVQGDPQPTAAGIQAACQGLVAAGTLEGPCRIDPNFEIADLSERIPPRNEEPPPAPCAADSETLCLLGGRFQVEVEWRDFEGATGAGQVVVGVDSDNSGLFWFFDPDNWEMLVKVLDGCGTNQRVWVFAAATTNVEYTLYVTDTETGVTKIYTNPLGTSSPATTDTDAFATCP